MAENDYKGWDHITHALGNRVRLVGDDLFVPQTQLLQKGVKENYANAILIKPNQVGTLTETLNTIQLANTKNYMPIISHRSGETEDTFIADLAIGTNTVAIKAGSMCRTDRVCKYNQIQRIATELGQSVYYAGQDQFI